MPKEFKIDLAQTLYPSLTQVRGNKTLREISKAIDLLVRDPEAQGKPLVGPLDGLRGFRAVRGRYRIIYKVAVDKGRVTVLLVGPRRAGQEEDIYALAGKLLQIFLKGSTEP